MKNFILAIFISAITISANAQIFPYFQWVNLDNYFLARSNPNTYEQKDLIFVDTSYVHFNVENVKFKSLDSNHGATLNYYYVTAVNDSGVIKLMPVDSVIRNCYPNSNPSNYISAEVDGSTTNEIQSLSGSGRRVILSGGGSYVMPLTSYDSLTNKPTIPTNTNQLTNGAGFLTSEVDGSVTNEIELPSMAGQSGKILSNNGTSASWAAPPTIKRQETYSGTSNGSGNYTVTFGSYYSVAPNIQANLIGNSTNQYVRIVSVSTTGFTVNAYSFNSLSIAGIVALLPTTTVINGANIDVLITEK